MGSSSHHENKTEKEVSSEEEKLEQSRVNLMRSIVEAKDQSVKVSYTNLSLQLSF